MSKEPYLEKELRNAIAQSGYSGYRLAKESGVPQGVLCRFINSQRTITLATASKLVDVLGLTLVPQKRTRTGQGKRSPAKNTTGKGKRKVKK